jgi:hypothetical protein
MVREHIDAGRLRLLEGAPEFVRPAFVVWQARNDAVLDHGVAGLRKVAAEESV